jgi:type II secretory pathway component PulM
MSARAAMGSRITRSLAPLRQRWHRLEARQQQWAAGGAVLLVTTLLFAYLWLPAVRERERLVAKLPQLHAQRALMQQQADEIRQLNSTSPIAPVPPAAADTATLQAAFGDGARVSLDASRAFRIAIPRIAYATWWERLGDVQSRHPLQLVSLSMQALPGGNREVSVDMLLADTTRGNVAAAPGAAK